MSFDGYHETFDDFSRALVAIYEKGLQLGRSGDGAEVRDYLSVEIRDANEMISAAMSTGKLDGQGVNIVIDHIEALELYILSNRRGKAMKWPWSHGAIDKFRSDLEDQRLRMQHKPVS